MRYVNAKRMNNNVESNKKNSITINRKWIAIL